MMMPNLILLATPLLALSMLACDIGIRAVSDTSAPSQPSAPDATASRESPRTAGERYILETNALNVETHAAGQSLADAMEPLVAGCRSDVECIATSIGPLWKRMADLQEDRIERLERISPPHFARKGHELYVS